jgi:Skp family chaperone for outer membrane proteins
MKQAIWILGVLIALVVGFFGGQLLSGGQSPQAADLEDRIAALESEIADLKAQLASQSGLSGAPPAETAIPRIAVLQVNDLALRFQENNPKLEERVQQESLRIQQELQALQQRFQQGDISREEASLQAMQLQQALQRTVVEAVAGPIQAIATQIAQERGYDVVVKREDVIVYYKDGTFDDITEDVWAVLKDLR